MVKFGDEVSLKKLKVFDETILLKPLNRDYDDVAISGKEKKHMRVVGKVVAKYVRY